MTTIPHAGLPREREIELASLIADAHTRYVTTAQGVAYRVTRGYRGYRRTHPQYSHEGAVEISGLKEKLDAARTAFETHHTTPYRTRLLNSSDAVITCYGERLANGHTSLFLEKDQQVPRLAQRAHDIVAQRRRYIEELVTANRPFVYALTRPYMRRTPQLQDDLVQDAFLGMSVAALHYDGTFRFLTYAVHWMRSFMRDSLRGNVNHLSGGSRAVRRALTGISRLERKYSDKNEERDEYIARELGISPTELSAARRRYAPHLSLERLEERGTVFIDEGPSIAGLEAALSMRRVRRDVLRSTQDFEPRERDIVYRRLMAPEEEEATLAAIGRDHGVSRERMRQLEQGVKARLRKRLAHLRPLIE